jgi:hypothetical protein
VALKENRKGGNLKRKKKRTTALLGFLVFSRKSLKTQTRSTKEKTKEGRWCLNSVAIFIRMEKKIKKGEVVVLLLFVVCSVNVHNRRKKVPLP